MQLPIALPVGLRAGTVPLSGAGQDGCSVAKTRNYIVERPVKHCSLRQSRRETVLRREVLRVSEESSEV